MPSTSARPAPSSADALSASTAVDVLIIGSGFSGMGMGIRLRRSGREDFLILEKAHDVGGTWRENTYPGCACDIPSNMYSFSYAPNPDWTRRYSSQPEIWRYLRRVADDFTLHSKIRFGVEVTSARWDEDEQLWWVDTTGGLTYTARVLVSGIGGLHIPHVPQLPGQEHFSGVAFHSAQWRHDVDLTEKRVAVVGTGASAIQFVPQIAGAVKQLTVYQRTAPWVLPRPDRPVPARTRRRFRRIPGLQRLHRYATYWLLEARAVGFNGHPALLEAAERIVATQLDRKVHDPQVRRQLLPDYRLGCKRVLSANDYYPTFNRDNVELTGAVERVTATGVVGSDGVERAVDVIIYATGFRVNESFAFVDVRGRDGSTLWEQFSRAGVETYLGINVVNFPNLCLLLGPNTALGHHSVVFMIEQQAAYVVRLLDAMDARSVRSVEVRPQAQQRYSDDIQARLARGIWSTGGCTSWYLDDTGRNRAIWPGFTLSYWWRTRRLDAKAYTWRRTGVLPEQSAAA